MQSGTLTLPIAYGQAKDLRTFGLWRHRHSQDNKGKKPSEEPGGKSREHSIGSKETIVITKLAFLSK